MRRFVVFCFRSLNEKYLHDVHENCSMKCMKNVENENTCSCCNQLLRIMHLLHCETKSNFMIPASKLVEVIVWLPFSVVLCFCGNLTLLYKLVPLSGQIQQTTN